MGDSPFRVTATRVSRVRSVRAWGPSTGPKACALVGRRCSPCGWRKAVPGGGAFHRCEGRLWPGAPPPRTARPLGGLFFARRHILSPVKTVRSNLHCKNTLQQKPVGRVTRWMPLTPLGQSKFGCSAPQDPVGRPPAHEGVIYAIYHESWMCIRNCKQNLANRGYFRRWLGWIG